MPRSSSFYLEKFTATYYVIFIKVVIIGGTGHAGTYLVPRLIEAGHEVVSVSRQESSPYQSNAMWDAVQQVQIDRLSTALQLIAGRARVCAVAD